MDAGSAVPVAFIINIGDLMARWTNDRWVSTVHRVVNPSPEDGGKSRRQSLAFFHRPTGTPRSSASTDASRPVETPKYQPVRVRSLSDEQVPGDDEVGRPVRMRRARIAHEQRPGELFLNQQMLKRRNRT